MTAQNDPMEIETPDGSTDSIDRALPRRTFLGGIASVGAASALRIGGNQDGDGDEEVDTHFRFGGRVEGWRGRSPSEIEDEENPTLELEPGTRYRVTWENVDGVEHDFTILDVDGNELERTETTSEQGETLSLTFTATEEMAQYVCTIHPNRMRGDVRIGGETPAEDTPTEPEEEVETQFELGAETDGWRGQSPSEIEGETNPTLDLQAGNRYRVTWENLDGVQHDFAILDADGNEMESTGIESLEGETLSLTFTATEEMAQYYCAIHTDRMRGDVRIDGATPEDTPTEPGEEVETRFELGGVIGGWQGRLPEERGAEQNIEGEENPTLELEAGTRYTVIWENGDGVPHNFTIQDADGNGIVATETTSRQGEKLSLTFTATREMAQYVCTIHPDTMLGEIQIGGDVGGLLAPGPGRTVGGMVAAAVGVAAAIAYSLSSYFDERNEP